MGTWYHVQSCGGFAGGCIDINGTSKMVFKPNPDTANKNMFLVDHYVSDSLVRSDTGVYSNTLRSVSVNLPIFGSLSWLRCVAKYISDDSLLSFHHNQCCDIGEPGYGRKRLTMKSEINLQNLGFSSIGLKPNPTTGLIVSHNNLPEYHCSVIDVYGRKVVEFSGKGKLNIDLRKDLYAKGLFLIKTETADKKYYDRVLLIR